MIKVVKLWESVRTAEKVIESSLKVEQQMLSAHTKV